MTERADRLWRILATGCSFLLFGLAALFLGVVLCPLLQLRYRDDEARELRVQAVIHRTFARFSRFMQWVGVIRVSSVGLERLARGGAKLVVANHPTLIDVVLLGAAMPQMDCVAKRATWSNPVMRGAARAAGFIPNDGGEATVEACARRLRRGRTLLLFPEGTRSPAKGLGPMKRGAAHVALAAGTPLLPVTIACDPPGLKRGQKWYDVPERPMTFTLTLGDPIAADRGDESRSVAARRITRRLREHFEKGVQRVET